MEQVIFTNSYSQIPNLLTACVSGMTGLRHFYVQCNFVCVCVGGVLSKYSSKVKYRYNEVGIYAQSAFDRNMQQKVSNEAIWVLMALNRPVAKAP